MEYNKRYKGDRSKDCTADRAIQAIHQRCTAGDVPQIRRCFREAPQVGRYIKDVPQGPTVWAPHIAGKYMKYVFD
ncbi:hypothetical protein [Roseburia faecis]|uniref:hypothetical protein n=1 Tax=Roseburia faecis TaxID=301302 RepID=UPI003F9C1A8B